MGDRSAIERTTGEPIADSGLRLLELSDDLLVVGDAEKGVVWANSAWERKLGIPRERILGEGYTELIHPDEVRATLRVWRRGAAGDAPADFRTRLQTADGAYRWFLWSPIFDGEHGLIYAVGKDITELEESQRELEESRHRLAEAQRVSHLGSWEWEPGSGQVTWTDELYRIFGLDKESFEPTYENYVERVHPEDRGVVEAAVGELGRTGEPVSFTHRVLLPGGGERVVHCRAQAEPGREAITGTCQDITEVRVSEQELAKTASLQRATLEAASDGILVVDLQRRIISFNQRLLEIWNLSEDALADRDDVNAMTVAARQLKDPEGFRARVTELYERSELEAFDVIEFADGRVVERYCRPQILDGETVGRVWSFHDVTDRLRAEREKLELEKRLQQSQRLESLGRLAGGIAHDFNNHLVAIRNYAALAGEELPDGSQAKADLEEVVRAADRVSSLTKELLAFSRRQTIEPEALDINEVIRDAERLLAGAAGDSVRIDLSFSPDLPAVLADPGHLERMLLNLVGNARDAMPGGGTVEIVTGLGEPTRSRNGGAGRPTVRLIVRDTGTGMTEDVATRAPEPFFTTKPHGEGTGLGLATVHGIVSQAGGEMTIDSSPGAGTTVTVELPAAAADPAEAAPATPAGPDTGARQGTVVVVEDELPVRKLTARLLRDAGFRTLEAADGDEALEMIERDAPDDIRLLLTDLVMPRMSGRELTERVHAARPGLPVLIMSGYTDDVTSRQGAPVEGTPILAKPFSRDSLLAAVGEAIEV